MVNCWLWCKQGYVIIRQTLIFTGSDPRHDFSWIPPGSLLSHSMLSWNIVKAAKGQLRMKIVFSEGRVGAGVGQLEGLHFPYIATVSKSLNKTDQFTENV